MNTRFFVTVWFCLLVCAFANASPGDSLLGNWVYQSPQGNLTLQFTSASQLTFNGDPAYYQVQGNNLIVSADGETLYYPYSLQNNQLLITFPDGTQVPFVKGSGSTAAGTAPAAGGQVFQELVGRWKDIRSSGNTIIELFANGQFSYYSDYTASNSNAGETNWGYGNSSGTKGTWQARGTAQQGVIYYQAEDGSQDTLDYRMHVEKGQIYWSECFFDGQLYQKQ
ncbi:MAG: hypothetical protein KKB51_13900 [Candidatus Riflebacteria bacterium]|nr:hypothetical protein [Candidatus Riflebacteria bacterium]